MSTKFKLTRNLTECRANRADNKAIEVLNRIFNNKSSRMFYREPFSLDRREVEVDLSGLINIFMRFPVIDKTEFMHVSMKVNISQKLAKHLLKSSFVNNKVIKHTTIARLAFQADLKVCKISSVIEDQVVDYALTLIFFKTV
jgi:hypothetical protein